MRPKALFMTADIVSGLTGAECGNPAEFVGISRMVPENSTPIVTPGNEAGTLSW